MHPSVTNVRKMTMMHGLLRGLGMHRAAFHCDKHGRSAFVQALIDQLDRQHLYLNALVLRDGYRRDLVRLEDITDHRCVEYPGGGGRYHVWIFGKGRLIRHGDQGWLNWACSGNHIISDDMVVFREVLPVSTHASPVVDLQ